MFQEQDEAPPDGRPRVVRLSGELDLATGPAATAEVRMALAESGDVVVDLRGLCFMDVTGMHVVLDVVADARRQGQRLVVVRPSADVEDLFALTGTDALLEFVGPEAADPVRLRPVPANPEVA